MRKSAREPSEESDMAHAVAIQLMFEGISFPGKDTASGDSPADRYAGRLWFCPETAGLVGGG